MDQKFDKESAHAVHASRMDHHRLSEDHEVAENDLNDGLGCTRALVGNSTAATSASSSGTNDRDRNELKYLQDALYLIDILLCREARDDYDFVTAENSPPRIQKEWR